MRAVGLAARHLLELAWSSGPRDAYLVRHALQCVARTLESDAEASVALLRRALEPTHLAKYGHEEAHTLATELKRLVPHDPVFVRDTYAALFGFVELSAEPTPMGNSQILAMISTRRQDYEMAQYVLAEDFPAFLLAAPEQAALALVASVRGYAAHRHGQRFERYTGGTFDFMGEQAHLEPDGSCMWDEGEVYKNDHAVEMVQAFEDYLVDAGKEPRTSEVRAALIALAKENRSAILWRRLLAAGTQESEVLGSLVRELAWAAPILTALDTSAHACEFIRVMFPILSASERERTEHAIMRVPVEIPEDEREWAERRRDSLLGCLPLDLVVSPGARERITQMNAVGGAPANVPPFQTSPLSWGEITSEGRLERDGVDVEAAQNRAVLKLRQSASDLVASQELVSNGGDALKQVTAQLTSLRALLQSASEDSVDPAVERIAWGTLAEVAVGFARLEVSCRDGIGTVIRGILGDAALRPDPEHAPERDAAFDESPSWSSPASRVAAAEGLMLLARHADCATKEVLETIDQLSRDPVLAVRLQIASHLWLLNRTAPEDMWGHVERMCAKDASSGVLQFLVGRSLGRLASLDAPRVMQLVRDLLSRFSSGPGVGTLREKCFEILTDWYVWRDVAGAREALFRVADARPIQVEDARHICGDLRKAVVADSGPIDPAGGGVRDRALGLIGALVEPALVELGGLLERGSSNWDETDRGRARELMGFADLVGREIYFATGIFQARNQPDREDERVTRAQRHRLFVEGIPLIEALADVGLPSLAHHLLEMLEENIPAEPRGTFLLIGRVLVAGKRGGYQYESLAEGLFVRLIERYLADYRTLYQEDEECRALLLEVLDIFVQAGWPSAQRLGYRLDEIFR